MDWNGEPSVLIDLSCLSAGNLRQPHEVELKPRQTDRQRQLGPGQRQVDQFLSGADAKLARLCVGLETFVPLQRALLLLFCSEILSPDLPMAH